MSNHHSFLRGSTRVLPAHRFNIKQFEGERHLSTDLASERVSTPVVGPDGRPPHELPRKQSDPRPARSDYNYTCRLFSEDGIAARRSDEAGRLLRLSLPFSVSAMRLFPCFRLNTVQQGVSIQATGSLSELLHDSFTLSFGQRTGMTARGIVSAPFVRVSLSNTLLLKSLVSTRLGLL